LQRAAGSIAASGSEKKKGLSSCVRRKSGCVCRSPRAFSAVSLFRPRTVKRSRCSKGIQQHCVLPGLVLYVLSWGQGGECWFAGQTSSRPAGTFNFSVEGTREQIKFKLLPARLLDVSRNASQVALPRRALQLCTAHRALPRALSCHRMTHATHGRSVDVHGHGASSLLRSPLRGPHRTEQQQ